MAINWLQVAAKTARHSTLDYQLGAVIVKGSSVLSTGFNKRRNEPATVSDIEGCHTHAEVDAISGASPNQLKGAVLYVARIGADGELRNAKPCWRCMDAIRAAGIKRVVWSNGPEIRGVGTSLKLNALTMPTFAQTFPAAELHERYATFSFREVAYTWTDEHVPRRLLCLV